MINPKVKRKTFEVFYHGRLGKTETLTTQQLLNLITYMNSGKANFTQITIEIKTPRRCQGE